ncbi:unnamed protein product [Arabidopsis lyrata]|nr:unnamed protein product [Arabidopsis lyrata]
MQVIPPKIKKILDIWNIRGLVILSLLFQTSLIFLAPLRKRTSKKWLAVVLWTAYLLADWTANYAVSQITKNQGKEPEPGEFPKNKKVLAMWAPFLLLHLGGPDTITALALEDNALWKRHLFSLVSQALACVYAVVQSMENVLWPPITLLFITGTIKYVESSSERDESRDFFNELKPGEALRIIESELDFLYELMFTKNAILHTITGTLFRLIAFGSLISSFFVFHRRPLKSEEFHGADIVITYTLFIVGIALDLVSIVMFLFSDWTYAVLSKLKDDPEEYNSFIDSLLNWFLAFRKLRCKKHTCNGNQTQEVLSTGFWSRRWSGMIYGFNFIGFCLKAKVSRIHKKRNCNVLVWESVGSMFDWIIRRIQMMFGWIKNVNRSLRSVMRQWSKKNPMFCYTVYPLYLVFFAGIPQVFAVFWGHIDRIFSVKSYLDEIRFISNEPLTKNQWEFIFNEVKNKSYFAETPDLTKKLSSARGEWVLRDMILAESERLMRYVENVSYDQSLLLWHIATELCFQQEENEEMENLSRDNYDDREFSKITSDYMMYLLIMRPKLMSQVAGIGTIRFRDTLAEAERFFKGKHIKNLRDMKRASKMILSVSNDYEPMYVKGNRSKSVLFDASMLAKELQRLEDNNSRNGYGKWRVLSKVWVELLCYAASQCKAMEHVAQLSRGGELLSFVWLLMAHFGLSDQFEIDKGEPRAILVAGE